MPSIVNGLFSGRSGIASHGTAIAVIGDNISNSSTVGFKSSRAEFQDLIAGGQTSGKVVGSGSSTSAVSTIFEQGTLEFTSRSLDLAIDGNGYFVVADGTQRFYTRAGNFKIDSSGYITNQNDLRVLGFPANGSGALESVNINTVSQDNVVSSEVTISGNVDAATDVLTNGAADIPTVTAPGVNPPSSTTYSELNAAAEFSTVVEIFDSLGEAHTATFFFYHTAANTWQVRGYVDSDEVDATPPATTVPREIGSLTLSFSGDGSLSTANPTFTATIPWNNGSTQTNNVDFTFDPFTQYASSSTIQSITQNGQGIGAVTSVSVEDDGSIFAVLDNGQTAVIGTIGMVNFANPEGLTRIGGSLMQQSASSGEPIVGEPLTGTFGAVSSGSIELSTVDIANEFVKIITLQRGFQANSRIITTINQLLNEIIQLA